MKRISPPMNQTLGAYDFSTGRGAGFLRFMIPDCKFRHTVIGEPRLHVLFGAIKAVIKRNPFSLSWGGAEQRA